MFVLAHLSDPHLGPVPMPRFRELTGKRALGFVNWHRRRFVRHRPEVLEALVHDLRSAAPDHIAVTGDLVNISLEKEFPPAREWLAQLGSPHDVSMVPGNHDAYVRDAIDHPASHWGDYMRGDGIGTGAPHSRAGPFPYVRRRGPAALIGLSTALPTAPFLATGKLGADQLMRFSDALAHLAHEAVFRIVLIHHPPAGGGLSPFKRNRDRAQSKPQRRVRGNVACGALAFACICSYLPTMAERNEIPSPASFGCTCLRLRKAARRITQIYDGYVEPFGLTITQFGLLAHLRVLDGISVGALAEKLVMDPTTLTRNLRPLERRGLVKLKPDPEDRRARSLHLSEAGRELLRAARPAWA